MRKIYSLLIGLFLLTGPTIVSITYYLGLNLHYFRMQKHINVSNPAEVFYMSKEEIAACSNRKGELKIAGRMYDVCRSRQIGENRFELMVVRDQEEEKLRGSFFAYLRTLFKDEHRTADAAGLIHFSIILFVHDHAKLIPEPIYWMSDTPLITQSDNYISPVLVITSPPPRFNYL